MATRQPTDGMTRYSLRSWLIWTTVIRLLVGLGARLQFVSPYLWASGVFLWPVTPVMHEMAFRFGDRGGNTRLVSATGLLIVAALTFVASLVLMLAGVMIFFAKIIDLIVPQVR
jgi:hypothetical protein